MAALRPLPLDPSAAPPVRPPRISQRVLMLGIGYLCLALAAIGALLPLMPTTVFLIGAAWAFGRSSPRLRARLLADPRIGPTLRNWQEHGVVSRTAKRAAVLGMLASWILVTLLFRDTLASILSALCMAAVAAWLLTRPSVPRGGDA